MFGIDFASIAKGFGEGILGPIVSIFNKQQDVSLEKYKVDGTVNHDLVNADVELNRSKVELAKLTYQFKGDRYLHYLFGYPVGIWWAAYWWDSGFRNLVPTGWTWTVLTPEPQVMTWAGIIIGSLFLYSGVQKFWRK